MLARILEALAPRRCAGCGEVSQGVCPGCARALELLPQPMPVRFGELHLHAAFLYTSPARELLHGGKYRDGRTALRILALLAAERFSALPAPAAVVPVPLGRARRRVRGYNQAEIAAGVVAELRGVAQRQWLRRLRETGSQVGRSPAARMRNLAGAFEWVGPRASDAEVWIVDDVITTGATMLAALDAAREGSGASLRGLALARAGEHLRARSWAPPSQHRGIMEP